MLISYFGSYFGPSGPWAERGILESHRARPSKGVETVAACPACRSGLLWESSRVRCLACSRTYPRSESGAPILLLGRSPAPEGAWYPGSLRLLPDAFGAFIERHRQHLCPVLTYRSPRRRNLVGKFVATFPEDALIANVGAGTRRYGPNVINVEVEALPGVDLVGVAEKLPLADSSVDGAVLQAVLEHVRNADLTLQELYRILKPGGSLLVEVPFIQGYHASPADYRRYTEQGLRAELVDHNFDVDESGVAVGPASAMAWVTAEFLAFLVSGRSERVYRLARPLFRWFVQPLKYADRWLDGHPMAYTIPSGVWARARRGVPS
jgi:SAM-dependent methyltransferase